MKKSIRQEEPSGCAISCVAVVLKRSYREARKLFRHPEYATLRGYYCREVVAALKKAGLQYAYRKIKKGTQHVIKKPGTIMFIKRSARHPQGHYVARVKNGWMNPWLNFPSMVPAVKTGLQKRLPGKAQWMIFSSKK